MRIAVYPGSFDPITNGHLDILNRSLLLFDKVIVGVLINPAKSPLLRAEDRVRLISESLKSLPEVEVFSFHGLTVNFAEQKQAKMLIRGLRAISDFEKELQMAQANKNIKPNIETVFLMSSLEYAYLSSSMVKEICFLGGDISDLVPAGVNEYLSNLREKRFQYDGK